MDCRNYTILQAQRKRGQHLQRDERGRRSPNKTKKDGNTKVLPSFYTGLERGRKPGKTPSRYARRKGFSVRGGRNAKVVAGPGAPNAKAFPAPTSGPAQDKAGP